MAADARDPTRRPVLWVLLGLLALGLILPGGHRPFLFLGLATGGAYALIAVGYTMVYGIIELINFAHGEVYMFGAYLALTFSLGVAAARPPGGVLPTGGVEAAATGVHPLDVAGGVASRPAFLAGMFALVGAAFVWDQFRHRRASAPARLVTTLAGGATMGIATWYLVAARVPTFLACLLAMAWASLLGVVMELAAYRPLRRAPRLAALITAIGLSLVLQNLAQWIWSASLQPVRDSLIPEFLKVRGTPEQIASSGFVEGLWGYGATNLFGTQINATQVFVLVVALLLMAGLTALIQGTRLGRAMRACAQDRDAAYLMGVDVDRVISWTFAIGSALGAAAGILIALYEFKIFPQMGYKAGVVAFAAAVLGGIGNVPGAMLGGVVLGISQAMSVWLNLSEWDLGIAYAVMILIILVQPEGLLGTQTPRKS